MDMMRTGDSMTDVKGTKIMTWNIDYLAKTGRRNSTFILRNVNHCQNIINLARS
jgi:hypothetical protein